jgi:hypothetical protein
MPYLGAGNDLCVNLADQVTALRTVLAELARPNTPVDEPELGRS